MFYLVLIGLFMLSAATADVRLIGGSHDGEGRVEVYHDEAWGTVCDDYWDMEDANVVCRSLGFPEATETTDVFGEGTGLIVLDDVACTGNESDIFDCVNAGLGISDCFHFEDVGVRCAPRVRLIGGNLLDEGRVEVYHDRRWGTVCDDNWDMDDANVVCRSLGFPEATGTTNSDVFGQGTGLIFLDDVACTGSESDIFDCVNAGLGIHNCFHSEDAGVRCAPLVRLVDGNNDREGRVEVFFNETWGTVCDDSWDQTDADVVCRSLGFWGAIEAVNGRVFNPGTGEIFLDDVYCTGYESDIFDCDTRPIGEHNCVHVEDAGARCATGVRLADGSNDSEGRVEVFYRGTWGTVCDDSWDQYDADVVCRSLGFLEAIEAVDGGTFPRGTGIIFLDDVRCTGDELNVFDCGHMGIGNNNCAHTEDAGVRCY